MCLRPSPAHLAGGLTVVVDVGRWSQPKLGAALPRGVHDTEVILSWSEEGPLLLATQLSNHPKQVGDPLVGLPATGGGKMPCWLMQEGGGQDGMEEGL